MSDDFISEGGQSTLLLILSGRKFPLGQVVITPNALSSLDESDIRTALQRHANGDWGDLVPEDREANDHALKDGSRLVSAYNSSSGTRFWIITEWDRSYTTILLPEDY